MSCKPPVPNTIALKKWPTTCEGWGCSLSTEPLTLPSGPQPIFVDSSCIWPCPYGGSSWMLSYKTAPSITTSNCQKDKTLSKVGNCAMLSLILIVPGPHCGLYGVGFPVLSITLDLNLSIAFCTLSFKKSLVKTVLDFLLENHLLLETKRLAGTGLDAFPFQPSPGFQEINQFPQLDTGVLPQK